MGEYEIEDFVEAIKISKDDLGLHGRNGIRGSKVQLRLAMGGPSEQ